MRDHARGDASRSWPARFLAIIVVLAWLAIAETGVHAQPLLTPMRIAQAPQGLLVSDYSARKVVTLDALTLEVEDTLVLDGQPLGLAWFNGLLYVANQTTGAIETYKRGESTRVPGAIPWTRRKNLVGKKSAILAANDMVADEEAGLLFVVSETDHSVLVFDAKGGLVRSIGAEGSSAPGSLLLPKGIALDPANQRIFVSDFGDPTGSIFGGANAPAVVQIYTYDGFHLNTISGSSGQPGFQFSRPQGVALDGSGRLYVTDSFISRILVFVESVEGWTGTATLGTKGRAPGQLLLPMDVFIDTNTSNIYVANHMNSRVEMFGVGDVAP